MAKKLFSTGGHLIVVDELMTRELHTLRADDSIYHAREMMSRYKIRHIPVVDAQCNFVGLLSERNVLAAAVSTFAGLDRAERDELERHIPLSEVMVTEIVVIESGADLREVARHFLASKHGCLPVVKEGALIGIITEADFVKLALRLMDRLAEQEARLSRYT